MTTGARLMAALECANDAGGRCALWPSGDAHACYGVSHDTATSCAYAAGSVSAARAALTGTGATPQSKGLVRVRGQVCLRTCPRPPGVAPEPSIPPGRVPDAMLKPADARTSWALALGAAAIAHAFRAPFPGMGGNPVLDLIAYHDPGLHTVIRVWYYAVPAVAVVLAGSVCLSVWRVWLQPPARRRGRGGLPAWPASPEDDAPSLVIGELHHPVVPRESERPSWLVIPETGLYTGVLVVGAVGSGKTTACMYPFAQQLLSWQADRAGRRASALVLEVKGDFCYKYGSMIANIVPCGPIVFHKAFNYNVIRRIRAVFTGSLLCRYVPYCTIVYSSICDTQVGYTTCANDPLRPPSWRG